MSAPSPATVPVEPLLLGPVNWIGLWTLCCREVRRFFKVYMQTVLAPVVTTLLFYAVFALSLGSSVRVVGAVPYLVFLAPGLIMMAMTQNAFANTSSSLIIAKVQGNIVDVLMPPLSPGELMVAFTLGGVVRGLVVGVVTGVAIWLFLPFGLLHPGYALYHGLMAVIMLSLLGVVGGIWAEKFDHIAGVTNFVVTPLSFLSGTFYSVTSLPEPVQWLAYADPFFYMIDGFRYGFTGQCDGSLVAGLVMMLAGNLGLGFLAWRMLKTGYKLKA